MWMYKVPRKSPLSVIRDPEVIVKGIRKETFSEF